MTDRPRGWEQISCADRELIDDSTLSIRSGFTDMTGEYGTPIVVREWGTDHIPMLLDKWWPNSGRPCVNYRSGRPCEHYRWDAAQ